MGAEKVAATLLSSLFFVSLFVLYWTPRHIMRKESRRVTTDNARIYREQCRFLDDNRKFDFIVMVNNRKVSGL